jgi:hypothetical protein
MPISHRVAYVPTLTQWPVLHTCHFLRPSVAMHALSHLPESVGQLQALTYLVLHGANSLEAVPDSLGDLNNLKHFSIAYCNK